MGLIEYAQVAGEVVTPEQQWADDRARETARVAQQTIDYLAGLTPSGGPSIVVKPRPVVDPEPVEQVDDFVWWLMAAADSVRAACEEEHDANGGWMVDALAYVEACWDGVCSRGPW